MFDNPFIHSSVMFRRAIVRDELGGYEPSFVSAEDFDLWSRVAERYPVRNLPQRLVDFRMHASSTAARWSSEHIARSSAIIERNLRSVLGRAEVPARWSQVLGSLHVDPRSREGLDGNELLDVLDAIDACYRKRHPDQNPEIRRIFAAKLGHIGRLFARKQPRAAFRAFRRAILLWAGAR
jgi:hypothetical protein